MDTNIISTANASPSLAAAVSAFFVKDMASTLVSASPAILRNKSGAASHLIASGFGEAAVATLGEQARATALGDRGA